MCRSAVAHELLDTVLSIERFLDGRGATQRKVAAAKPQMLRFADASAE
jgi:hypothetical protein